MSKSRKGHPRFYELIEEMKDVHDRKNANYAQDHDPLSNLRATEDLLDPWVGTVIRIGDKWSRLKELAKGKPDLVGESVKDTLIDMANYALLCIILLEESTKGKKE